MDGPSLLCTASSRDRPLFGGGGLIFFLIIFFAISFCLSFRMHDLRQGSKPKAACVWRELYVLEGAGFLIGARSE